MEPLDTSPAAEARRLLSLHGGALDKALGHVEGHLGVIQTRSQFLLTIGTLALTITGFSGPKIAEASRVSAIGMSIGLLLVLSALVLLLLGSLRIRWLSYLVQDDHVAAVAAAVAWRDRKARWFLLQLLLLVAGLSAYVLAVVWYFLLAV
ncbi:MAG: hypothetical protein EA402_05470 [Planctomycetota bacterium]|nr:MAG: hypothetical protein EA402_05470 [Planctomycetota bacterium]